MAPSNATLDGHFEDHAGGSLSGGASPSYTTPGDVPNFSYTAENLNIEFGLLVRDGALARSIEQTMAMKHGSLYELV